MKLVKIYSGGVATYYDPSDEKDMMYLADFIKSDPVKPGQVRYMYIVNEKKPISPV